jgi:hypothetical protein
MPPKKEKDAGTGGDESVESQQSTFQKRDQRRGDREPPRFSGSPSSDSVEWLKEFERVARYNQWKDEAKLSSVVFSLDNPAKTWYDNVEAELVSWETFLAAFKKKYEATDVRRRNAERMLALRVQSTDESVVDYIEDVIKLCGRVKDSMVEEEVLYNIKKGVDGNTAAALFSLKITSVTDYRKEAAEYDKEIKLRINQNKMLTLPTAAKVDDGFSPARMCAVSRAQTAAVERATKDSEWTTDDGNESAAGMFSSRGTDENVVIAGIGNERYRSRERFGRNFRKTEVMRTGNRIPLCFFCGRPGHVVRYCPAKSSPTPSQVRSQVQLPGRYDRGGNRSSSPSARSVHSNRGN